MSNECKNCNNVTEVDRMFCSTPCRNSWMSEYMIRKSKKIKKEIGNSYYAKKKKR